MSLLQTLISKYESQITSIAITPSEGGRFEISKDGALVFSKLATGRYPTNEELTTLLGLI